MKHSFRVEEDAIVKDFRRSVMPVGIACVIAALTGGGITLADIHVPIIDSPIRQILLGCLGFVLVAVRMWPRRSAPLHTFLVRQPSSSLSWASGTISNPQFHTKRHGGGLIRIAAAGYHRSPDGKAYIFTDQRGEPIRELPSSWVKSISRAEKDRAA